MRCAVLGATGYIGGRLVPELVGRGHAVRAVARSPGTLADVPWRDQVDVVAADVTDSDRVATALAGQDVVYYLVHSLHQRDFVALDRAAARTVATCARTAGVRRIVYLGGISPTGQRLSPHLASRAEVGRILLDSGVPTVVLQAAIIIGSGSASFEMLRYLSERLPVMVTPRWVHNHVQPIAVRDVLHYLAHAGELLPDTMNRGFDIGGPDVLTYLEMMRRYATVADLPRRLVLPVPLLTPWLSAQWVNLVTPVPRSIAVPLIESLVHEVVCHDRDIADQVPDPAGGLTGYERAVDLALSTTHTAEVPTRWSGGATPRAPSDPLPTDPSWSGGTVYEDVRERGTRADTGALWQAIEAVAGTHGRWRVEHIQRPHLLRLRAEMPVPGRAWLEMSATPTPGGSLYRQRAVFEPHGLAGHLYWKAVAPFQNLVFGGMARTITGAAEHQRGPGTVLRGRRRLRRRHRCDDPFVRGTEPGRADGPGHRARPERPHSRW